MKKIKRQKNERQQIPSFSDMLFYSILNFTTDSLEFVSDLFHSSFNRQTEYKASDLTCDQLIELCLSFVPEDEKSQIMNAFNGKNALAQYGKDIHSLNQEATIWPTAQEKRTVNFLLDIERDKFSGAIKGYFYIFENSCVKKRTIKTSSTNHKGHSNCHSSCGMDNSKQYFDKRLDAAINRKDKDYALVYIDIANFEEIKTFLKYEDSLSMISTVSDIIKSNLREHEAYCNVYFSSFILLLKYETPEKLERRLQNISDFINSLQQSSGSSKVSAKLSHGISLIKPGELKNATLLTKQAVVAQSHNKAKGLGEFSCTYFDEEMQQKLIRERYIETNMLEALQTGKFDIHLQPKFEIATKKMIGAEALARWHDNGDIISPKEFIPLFEANSSIIELDLYIFELSCALLRKWINESKSPIPLSVNISKLHLQKTNFFKKYRKILAKYDIPPEYIELEITESILTENPAVLKAAIAEIHGAGMRCSLDDFGSGYSSLNLIKEIEVDSIKIDRTFFLYSTSHENKAKKVIESIINIAKELSMKIVAEGVETEEQIHFLGKTGCDIVQCFLTSKPLDVESFERNYFPESAVC